jgi:hypothetical protein
MKKEEQNMKVGDRVRWTSQAAGFLKEKRGEIVEVLPPRRNPIPKLAKWQQQGCISHYGGGMTRDHESYLVKVVTSEKAKPRIYWPRVSKLVLLEEA